MKEHFFTTRSQRRNLQRQFSKAIKFPKTVPANDAFKAVKSGLTDFGWTFKEKINNSVSSIGDVGTNGKCRITSSPALILCTEAFHITLIPHKDGIEISRLEVFENFQRRGYAGSILKSLIVFLLQNDIDDIFLIPGIAGSLENLSPTALDIYQLEWFYLKRGFREMPKTGYWKLDKGIFLNFIKEDVIDFELLKIDYIPSTPDYAIEKSFKRKLESMPVKMMIHRRA